MTHTVIRGVIGADAHTIGSTILGYALEEARFKTISLGVMVSQQEFVDAAKESNARAVLVSSLYGMALLDCDGLREKCEEAGLGDMLLYIGGQLTTTEEEWGQIERKFKELGFDRVYPPGTLPETVITDLRSDLAGRSRGGHKKQEVG